ncbi:MAG: helix-turn-helix domain-containing protein [Planctomycetota bacterium]|jgi:excisionase family DNA binding protein
MGRHVGPGLKFSHAEMAQAFDGPWGEAYPPILTVEQAARLAGVPVKTIYDWKSRGLLRECAARRGKRLRIYRDRFVRFLFGGEE